MPFTFKSRESALEYLGVMKWIKSADRLPEHHKEVLSWGPVAAFNISYYDARLEQWFEANHRYPTTVTHWMQLEPPTD